MKSFLRPKNPQAVQANLQVCSEDPAYHHRCFHYFDLSGKNLINLVTYIEIKEKILIVNQLNV